MKTTDKIILEHVYKKYKHKKVINDFNYEFCKGNIYLLTGENGCGKSTLLRLIGKYVSPSKGRIKNNLEIGYAPDKIMLPSYLTVNQFLLLLAKIRFIKEINNDDIKLFQINKYLNEKLNTLSKGTYQKINIIQALMHNPDLYLFDEPLSGLDQNMQERFIMRIKNLKDLGKIIIIATHYVKSYENIGYVEIKIGDKNE